ncbi:MAG: glycosyltransferase family 2 protein [Polymorphobacter sp.]
MTTLNPGWSVVIAYYNEAAFLGATLDSLAAQTLRPLTLVLVDNGSGDAGPALARDWAAAHPDVDVDLRCETTPGQVHALAHGIAAVTTALVAIGDADTIYPPDYLAKAEAVFAADPGIVAVFAHASAGAPHSLRERLVRAARDALLIGLARGQTYAGGYAHLYRTAALRAAGGYSPALWPYVLKDHELVNRVAKQGRFGRTPDLWCLPSDRRPDRGGVRWSLFERILYHATPFAAKDWFFYRFFGPRLAARGMRDTVLRKRGWEAVTSPDRPN